MGHGDIGPARHGDAGPSSSSAKLATPMPPPLRSSGRCDLAGVIRRRRVPGEMAGGRSPEESQLGSVSRHDPSEGVPCSEGSFPIRHTDSPPGPATWSRVAGPRSPTKRTRRIDSARHSGTLRLGPGGPILRRSVSTKRTVMSLGRLTQPHENGGDLGKNLGVTEAIFRGTRRLPAQSVGMAPRVAPCSATGRGACLRNEPGAMRLEEARVREFRRIGIM